MDRIDVQIRNGQFVNYDEIGTPNRIQANGWTCTILHDGCEENGEHVRGTDNSGLSLFCTKMLGDNSIRFTLSSTGYAKLTSKKPNERLYTLSSGYVINRGIKFYDGILQLYEDKAFFVDEHFKRFLKTLGIDSVVHLRVNERTWSEYTTTSKQEAFPAQQERLWTDGHKEEISREVKNVFPHMTKEVIGYRISGARWVISCETSLENRKDTRTLFTMINDAREMKMALMHHPIMSLIIRKNAHRLELEDLITKKVTCMADVEEVINEANRIQSSLKATAAVTNGELQYFMDDNPNGDDFFLTLDIYAHLPTDIRLHKGDTKNSSIIIVQEKTLS